MPHDARTYRSRTLAEFRFLLVSALAGIAFGVIHDSIDVYYISPYFYRILKHAPPRVPVALWAAGVGAVSAWWMGLFIGAAMLQFARIGARPPLSATRLYRWMVIPLAAAALGSLAGGLFGRWQLPLLRYQWWRDRWPDAVWTVEGMHLGVYAGSFVGSVIAFAAVCRARRQMG